MIDESTPGTPRNRRTLRLVAAGGATAALLAAGSVAAFAAGGTGTPTPKPSATASPGAPGQPGSGTRPSPRVHAPHLDGTVTAVSGSIITITDRDGFSREIKVSGSTTYTDGLTAIPKVGDKVHAEGTVDTDKTTLDATTVGLMTEHAGGPGGHGPGGKGGPGPGGPGGPGGHGPGGTAAPRPSGSPTPSPSTKP